MKKRGSFSSKVGFVLAASGSAVGLGNIWRFPYLAAKYGGGTFLLCYLILAVTFGFTLMIAEIAIGRKTRLSTIGSYKSLDSRFGFLGMLSSAIPFIIFPYYCVIGGWVVKYLATFATGGMTASTDDSYFTTFIGGLGGPLLWFCLFVACTAIVVLFGVEKGIEKVSTILMPVLVLLTVGIAVYTLTIDGALAGFVYYVKPDLAHFSVKTVLAAMGQLFYSMSLAMGIMITYGSYMKKENPLESSVRQIEFFDTAIAFFAGMMIIPAVYAFSGGDESAMSAGPGLMFITLPKVFASMPGGSIVGTVFFVLVFFAALTSAISLMETLVSIIMDKMHWTRKKTCIFTIIFTLVLGIPSSLGFGVLSFIQPLGMSILDAWDFLSNSVLMPIAALFTCIFVGFFIQPKTICDEVRAAGAPFQSEKLFTVMIKWVAPIFLVAILLSSILNAFGVVNI